MDAANCTKMTVNEFSTTADSISLDWIVAENGDDIQFGSDYQIMTVINEQHPTQLGVLTANQISRRLDCDVRHFVSNNGLSAPGVKYTFELKLVRFYFIQEIYQL